jgi:hypothetical protein
MVSGPTLAIVQRVVLRDGGRCVCCRNPLEGERGFGWSIHHRRGRDGKPDSHQPQNLLSVCGGDNVTGCHGRIHSRRSEAQPNGWWLSRIAGTDPLAVPVLVGARLLYLTAEGGTSEEPPA